MRTVLDEVFIDEFPTTILHKNNCGCYKCSHNLDLEQLLEGRKDEFTTLGINYACEPGNFFSDSMKFIHWGERDTPTKRKKLSRDEDIKILGRGRKKVPFGEIAKALLLYRNSSLKANDLNWSTKIPGNIGQIFPEVDLTIDLFYNNNELPSDQILKSTIRHIKENRIPEYTKCAKGFVFMYNVPIKDYQKIENQFHHSLAKLFQLTGIKLPLEKNQEDMNKFFFLVYFVFPDELERYLIEPKPGITALTENEIKQLVSAILGEKPRAPNPFWSFYKFVEDDIPNKMPKFYDAFFLVFKLYFKGLKIIFEDNAQKELQGVIGSAYALMDAAIGFNRGSINSSFKRKGYQLMKKRLVDFENIPEISEKHKIALKKLAEFRPKSKAIELIYQTLLIGYKNEGNTQARSIMAAELENCKFKYPAMESNCNI